VKPETVSDIHRLLKLELHDNLVEVQEIKLLLGLFVLFLQNLFFDGLGGHRGVFGSFANGRVSFMTRWMYGSLGDFKRLGPLKLEDLLVDPDVQDELGLLKGS
jgi:hypothetical protein